jgi:hypothetical protein
MSLPPHRCCHTTPDSPATTRWSLRTALLGITAITILLVSSSSRAEPYVYAPSFKGQSISTPEAVCNEKELEDRSNHDFQRDDCLCRKAASHEDLRVCYPTAKDAQNDYVPVVLTIRLDDAWSYLPIALASFESRENSDTDINTWIGRDLRIISARHDTWRIQLKYERIVETKVHFNFGGNAGGLNPNQAIDAYRCTGRLAITVDTSGRRPILKTVADESFDCRISDSDFGPDTNTPHRWFRLEPIGRHFQLSEHGTLLGPGLSPACFNRPRLFPLRHNPRYEHFSRWK